MIRAVRRGVHLRFPPCCIAHYAWDVYCGAPPGLARWRQIENSRELSGRAVPCGVVHRGDSPFGLLGRIRRIWRFTAMRVGRSEEARLRRRLEPWHTRRSVVPESGDGRRGYLSFDETVAELEQRCGNLVLIETLLVNGAKVPGQLSGQAIEGLSDSPSTTCVLERLPSPLDEHTRPYDRIVHFGSFPAFPEVSVQPERFRFALVEGTDLFVVQGPWVLRIAPFGRAFKRELVRMSAQSPSPGE